MHRWYPRINAYATFVFLITALRSASPTTLAIVRTPEAIYIASDSAIEGGTDSKPFCKISQINDIFVAYSGTPNIRVTICGKPVPNLSFYGFKLARMSAQRSGTIAQRGDAFSKQALDPFRRAVQLIKINTPKFYKSRLLGHAQALEVVFFGMDPGHVPAFDIIDFAVSEDRNGNVVVTPNRLSCGRRFSRKARELPARRLSCHPGPAPPTQSTQRNATGNGSQCGRGLDRGWVMGWVVPSNVPTVSVLPKL